jgi:hypothetical protein
MPTQRGPGALAGARRAGRLVAGQRRAPDNTASIRALETLEKAADDLLARLAGAPVVVGYGAKGTAYRTLSGKLLPRRIVEHLIQAGRLTPCGDGLLPDCSQTMRAAGGGR